MNTKEGTTMPLGPMLPERRTEPTAFRSSRPVARPATQPQPRQVLQSGRAPAQLTLFLRPSGAP